MTHLLDVTEEVGRRLQAHYQGRVSSASGKSLIDNYLSAYLPPENVAGGTVLYTYSNPDGTHQVDTVTVATDTIYGITVSGTATVTATSTELYKVVSVSLEGGVNQAETATVGTSTITLAGDVSVTITSSLISGTIPVHVDLGWTANDIANAIRVALVSYFSLVHVFDVSGSGALVVLTAVLRAANDATLNIAIQDGTSVGCAASPTSANTTAGVAPDTATTAAEKIKTALNSDADVSAVFAATRSSANVILTKTVAEAYDSTVRLALATGTCTGLTSATSANTTAGVAPGGTRKLITPVLDFNLGQNTLYLQTTLPSVIGAPVYHLVDARYPLWLLVDAINAALGEIELPAEDTSLTTSSTRYYASTNAILSNLRQVWVATSTTAPYDYEPALNVGVSWATATAPQLVFHSEPGAGYKIKLVYTARQSLVYMDDANLSDSLNVISDAIAVPLLATSAAIKCLQWRLGRTQPATDEKGKLTLSWEAQQLQTRLEALRSEYETLRRRYPLPTVQSFPILPSQAYSEVE